MIVGEGDEISSTADKSIPNTLHRFTDGVAISAVVHDRHMQRQPSKHPGTPLIHFADTEKYDTPIFLYRSPSRSEQIAFR